MKGISKIELFNSTNEKICEYNDNNMLTNVLSEGLSRTLNACYTLTTENSCFSKYVRELVPKSLIGGILLYKNRIDERANNFFTNQSPLGYAGSSYDLSNPMRGTLNTQETGDTIIDGKAAYRWVWDFGTANCNFEFASIALTDVNSGNGEMWGAFSKFNALPLDLYTPNHRTKNSKINYYDDNIYTTITNGYTWNVFDKLSFSKKMELKTESVIFEKYTEINQLHFIHNTVYGLGKNTTTNNYEIFTAPIGSATTTTLNILTGITSSPENWCILGTNKLAFNAQVVGYTGNSKTIQVYNMETNTMLPQIVINLTNPVTGTENQCGQIRMFKADNGFCMYFESYNFYFTYQVKGFVYGDLTNNIRGESSNASYDTGRGGIGVSICDTPITISSGRNDYHGIRLLGQTLFTINNLETPITKTASNTMKISYAIIHDGK